jgi:D-serine deaminase-like pyridoxal phosphate-dependent protein
MRIEELKTPCALVDLDRLERNAQSMADRTRRLDVRLRPHVKTHKCIEAARIQTRGQFGGITVSTLAEARAFAAAGFRDITYAVPLPLDRLSDCIDLHRRLDAFHILVDHPHTLSALESQAVPPWLTFSVYMKVDSGLHRAGLNPLSEEAMTLASALDSSPHVVFRGLLTHAGQSYECKSFDEMRTVAKEERDAVVILARRLRDARIEVTDVSVGSTPTMAAADDLAGVTEVRPGNYMFYDAHQMAIGSCAIDDIAFSVLARVIGTYPERSSLVANAGATALSKDPGPIHVQPDCGYGIVVTPGDQRPMSGIKVLSLSQEHCVMRGAGNLEHDLGPGTLLRILPNHSCLAAACFDRYHVVRGDEVVDEWHPVQGW